MTNRTDRGFLAALSLITCVYLVLFGYYLGATSLRVPVIDVVAWIMRYMDHWLTGDWWGYFWPVHNGHRLIWSRLLMIADLEWTGGSAVPFILFGLLCMVVLTGAMVQEVMASDVAPAVRATVGLMIVLLLATSYNAIDCSVPQLGLYLHTCAFVGLALVLWDGGGEGGKWATLRRLCALLAAISAAFGVSGGILIWPVLHWAAWRGKLGLRWLVLLWLIGAPFIAFYMKGIVNQGGVTTIDGPTLLLMMDYLLRFLGLPWSHSWQLVNLGRVIGFAVLVGGTFAILRFGILRPPRGRMERIAIGLLLFSFMTAAVITFGRLNTAPDRPMPIRYALFTSMAQVGLLMVAAPRLSRLWAGRWHGLVQAVILAVGVLLLGQQVLAGQAGVEGAAQYTTAFRDFEAGRTNPDQEEFIGDQRAAERVLVFLHAHGLYRANR
jgi:hypothetical protein